MKPLLSRLLGGKGVQSTSTPTTPVPKTVDSLKDHQRLSVVGWIANKLGVLVGVDGADKGVFLFDATVKDLSELDSKSQDEYLLYLADKLVSWIENNEDVYYNIRQIKLEDTYHKRLLEVYEIVKADETIYFNRKSDKEEVSEDARVWEVYRDVLHAASSRKFLLIHEEELKPFTDGRVLCNEPVIEKSDIPKARNKAKESMIEEGIPSNKISSYTLLISEAITNILKHAKDGRLLIVRTDKSLNILIEDTGSGFPLKILPYTVLMAGYSTKKSLGQGFTLMLKLATQVLLKTSSSGSAIVLIFEEDEGEEDEKAAKST